VNPRTRRIFWTALKTAIAAAILIYLIDTVEPSRMISALKNARPFPIIIAVCLAPVNIFWLFCRWRYLLKFAGEGKRIADSEVWGSVLSGVALRLTTPGGLGESGRIFYVRGVSRVKLLALSAIDGLASFSITAVIGFCGLAYVTDNAYLVGCSLFYILAVIAAIKLRQRIDPSKFKFLPNRFRMSEFWEPIRHLPTANIAVLIVMALGMYAGYSLQYFLYISAFREIAPVNAGAAISSIMLVKAALPVSFGDLGIRESAAIYFFRIYNISDAVALDASLLLFTFNLLLPAIIGATFIPRLRLRASEANSR